MLDRSVRNLLGPIIIISLKKEKQDSLTLIHFISPSFRFWAQKRGVHQTILRPTLVASHISLSAIPECEEHQDRFMPVAPI